MQTIDSLLLHKCFNSKPVNKPVKFARLENSLFYLKSLMTTNTSSKNPLNISILGYFLAIFFIFTGISCSFNLPECNVCSSPPLTELNGRWELVRWNLPPENAQIRLRNIPHGDQGEPIFIQFDSLKKLLSGYSGCNNFFSHLNEDSKGAIELGPIGSTRKMCIENYRSQLERDFFNILDDYSSWQQKQNQLLLLAKSGDVLVFVKRNTP